MSAPTCPTCGLDPEDFACPDPCHRSGVHRACTSEEHDAANGKIHGLCVICGVPFPCPYGDELARLREAFVWHQGRDQGLSFDEMFKRRLAVSRLEDKGMDPVTALLSAHEGAKKQ